MDERRYQHLLDKRRVSGLTDAEADELGRMLAERAGKPYSNASRRPSRLEDPAASSEPREEPGSAAPPGSAGPPARPEVGPSH